MNEEALRVLYGLAQGDGYKKSFDEFKTLMSQNSDAVSTMYGLAQGDGYKKSKDEFNTLVGFGGTATETVEEGPKKKEESASTATEQASASESQQPQETTTSGTSQRTLNGKPLIVAYNKNAEPVYLDFSGAIVGKVGDPVFENQLAEEERLVYERTGEAPKKVEGGLEYTTEDGETVFAREPEPLEDRLQREQYEAELRRLAGTPQQEEFIETQGPMAGLPVTQPLEARGVDVARDITQNIIQEDDSPMAARDPFGVAPLEKFPTATKASEKTMGENLWEDIKEATGMVSLEEDADRDPLGLVAAGDEFFDFFGDMARSVYAGQDQGAAVEPSLGLMRNGREATDEEIDRFITAYNKMMATPPSEEMQSFANIYEEGGKTFASWFNGVKANPSVLPALFLSSTAAMASSQGTKIAAMVGLPLAAINPNAGLALAMGISSGTLDGALTFGELLQEEIGEGVPLTNENIRAVLDDNEAYNRIWNESVGRGLTIGTIDAATGIAAVPLVARTYRATTKLGRLGSGLASGTVGATVESAGGGLSEVAGRAVAGQEQDAAETAFEAFTSISTAPIAAGIYIGSQPQYKMNGGVASRADVVKFLETSTDQQFAATPIDIVNDNGLLSLAADRKNKIKNIKTAQENLVAAGVTDPKKVSDLSKLESEKQQLEGNDTEAGKRRLQEVNDQINSILDEPTEVTTETEGIRIYEGKDKNGNTKQVKLTTQESGRIRLDIVNDDGSTALIGDFPAESTDSDIVSNIIDIEQDFNIVKPQDAIQESSTETVDVQEPTRDSEAVGERDATGPVTTEVEAEVQVEETPLTVREEAADLAAMVGEELQAPAPTTEAAPTVTEEVTTTPATEKQKGGYNKSIEKGIRDANKATTTKERAKALQTIITNTTAIQERHGESFVTDEQQAEIDRLTQELANEGAQISENVQKGKEVGDGQIIDIDIREEDDTLPIGTTVIKTVNTPELFDSEGNLVQRGNVDVRVGTRKFTQAESNAKIAEIEKVREAALNSTEQQFHESINEDADADIAEVRKNTETAPTTTEAAPAVTEETGRVVKLDAIEGDINDSDYSFQGNSDRVGAERPTNDRGVKYDDNGSSSSHRNFKEKFGVESPNYASTLTQEKAIEAGVDEAENIGKVVSQIHDVDGERFLQLAFNADEYQRRRGSNGGIMIKIPDGVDVQLFESIHREAFQRAIDKNIGNAANNTYPVDYSAYDFFVNQGAIVSDMNTAKADIIAKGKKRTAPVTETTTTEAAPDVTEEATVTEEDRPLTEEQREVMYETRQRSGIDGLAYDENYINDILYNILGDAGSRTFAALWRKHVDPNFTKYLIEPGGGTFDLFISDELGQGAFSQDLTSQENGMQKFIDLVNDANKKLEKKEKQTIDLVPLERTAPAVTEAAPVTEETAVAETTTEAAPAPKESKQDKKIKENQEDIDRLESDISYSENRIEDLEMEIELEKGNTKEEKKNFAAKRAAIKDLKISREEKAERREELKFEQEDFVEDQKALIQGYKEDISGEKSDIKAAQRKINKLKKDNEKLGAPIAKASAKPKPTTKPAPAPKVEPVAKGVDPFYDSVEAQQKQEERISKLAAKARTAIKKILPDAKVILHKTESEYNKATKANSKGSQGGAGSRGVLIGDTIHVNMPHANDRTIAHEVFHALLTNLSKENSVDVIALTKKMAASLRGKIKDKEILAELDKFVDQYSGEVDAIQAEEMVAEFMGILAERYNSFDKPTKGVVQRFLERLADLLGLRKTFVPSARTRKGQQTTVALLETLAGKVATGQQIFEEDIMALVPYKDGQPDFQAEPDNLTVQEIDDMSMREMFDLETEATERQLSYKEQVLFYEDVQVTREEYIGNRGKPDAKNIRYAKLFTKEPGVDEKAEALTEGYGVLITEEDIFDYIDARADTKGKFTQKNLKFLRDNDLLELGQRFQGAPKSPKQQMAELAEDYNINVKGFLSTQINDGILRPKLRKLGYELRRHSGGFSIRDANDKMYRPPTGRGAGRKFQLFGGKDANVAEILTIAKESNITRQATKEFLMSNRGLTAKQADKLLNVSTANMYTMPVSFGNIGLNDGIALFERVANYADKIAQDKKVKVMDRLPMTLEFLEKQPEYIAQADKKTKGPSTIQMQMQSDVQKALGLKKTADMSKRLKALNEKVRQRKKGARDLKATQRELRNFIRKALPADLYSKSDVVKMMGKITSADESNIQKLTNEVVEFVTEKQVNFLEKTIDSILNGKYETVQSGRKKGMKIDSETRQRFEDIKKNIVGENVPAEDVVKDNATLNAEYKALEDKIDRTIQDDERMLDLAAAMAINNSKLMDNTDVNKVESLQQAEDILSGILGEGKQAFKARLQADHERYKRLVATVYKDITGLEIDPNEPNMVSQMKENQAKIDSRRKTKMENIAAKAMENTNTAIKNYIRNNYDVTQLMKVIMEAPGAAIEGNTEAIVVDGLNEATRTFKEVRLNDRDQIRGKLQEIFGKKWSKALAAGAPQSFTGVYIDKQAVADAKAEYDKNPTKENKEKYEAIEAVNNIKLSPNEIAYLNMQHKDPALLPSFENPANKNFGPDHERIMNELVATIDKGHVEFGEWMVNEFLPSKYEFYNDSYEQVYRTNLPWNQYYATRIYRVGGGEPKTLNLLGQDAVENKVVGAASSKVRRQNIKPIEAQDMYNNLMTYLEEMNWMASHAPTLRDMDKIFSNPAIKDAISNLGGTNLNDLIKVQLERIAAQGINPAKGEKFVRFANNLFVTTSLGGYKPNIMFKQLTSFLTYGNEIGPVTYTKYSAMSTGEFKSTWKEVMKNSVYVRDRVTTDFKRLVANYDNEKALDIMPTLSKDKWQNILFFFSRVGDIGAIFIGGVPNYRYYKADFKSKNPNATEQEAIDYAIRKFEKDTKSTQASYDLQDKDYYQTGNALYRAINMFKTVPKQYMRKEFEGIRQMRRAVRDSEKFEKTKLPAIIKGPAKTLNSMFSDKEFQKGLRTFITFQAVLPAFFQWVAIGFPGLKDFDDEDKGDMLRSIIIGPFNGLFIMGDLLTGAADMIQDKEYAGTLSFLPLSQQFNTIANYYKWWSQSNEGSDSRTKWGTKLFFKIAELVGGGLLQAGGLPALPLYNMKQMYDNMFKAADADDGREVVLRMLNYSDYQIGSGDKKKGSKRKSTPVSGSSRRGSSGRSSSSRRSRGR